MTLACSSPVRAADAPERLLLILAPNMGTVRIDREGAPPKQLELGLTLGLARGMEVLWAGVMLGVVHLGRDDVWLWTPTLRAQAFIIGAELGPALVTGAGGVGTGMRARAFISLFYVGGTTIAAAGSPRHRLENTFEMGVSLPPPIPINRKTPQISPSDPK